VRGGAPGRHDAARRRTLAGRARRGPRPPADAARARALGRPPAGGTRPGGGADAVRVDAHVHFWGREELARYEWMTLELDAIRRPFAPDDLRPLLAAHGFDSAVFVQTYAGVEETRAVLDLAARDDVIAGVVG